MKVVLIGTLLGAILVGCSSRHASVSPEERLAVHFGARGEMHEHLEPLAGEFEVTSHYWPRPTAVARVSGGVMTGSWDEQGMCMRSEYRGELLGTAMQVVLASTWDDVRGCYVGVWTREDGSTVLPLGDGHQDEQGAIVTMRCEDDASLREILRIVSMDEHVREVYRTTPEGEEYLSWRLEMVRAQD